jgi:hypothetical protein
MSRFLVSEGQTLQWSVSWPQMNKQCNVQVLGLRRTDITVARYSLDEYAEPKFFDSLKQDRTKRFLASYK